MQKGKIFQVNLKNSYKMALTPSTNPTFLKREPSLVIQSGQYEYNGGENSTKLTEMFQESDQKNPETSQEPRPESARIHL